MVADPQSMAPLRGIEALWGTCHDFGTPSVDASENEATVRIADALPMSEIEGVINMGWIRGVLEVAGAHDLHCEILEKPWEGAKEQAIRYRWA